jgi:phosphatidylglycerophosphate synthase/putative flippase GtrA
MMPWLFDPDDPSARIVRSLAPAVLALGYAALGLAAWAIRSRRSGPFRDEEMDHRGTGGLTTAGLRHFFAWLMRPVWSLAVVAQVPPNAITTLSLGLSVGAGVALSSGHFALGGWLFVTAGSLDFVDGRVARVTGRVTRTGAVLDSVLDRYAEAAVLVGLAWYYRSSWVLVPALLAVIGSQMVPYVRAKGEALGASMKSVGFMQRPERIAVLGLGTAFAPVVEAVLDPMGRHPAHRLAMAALVLIALTSHATALQRLQALVRSLSGTVLPARTTFLRALFTSALATSVDFVVANLADRGDAPATLATVAGCAAGGLVAWMLCRVWTFAATGATSMPPLWRFAFVWASSTALNTGGVWVGLCVPGMSFLGSWLLTRAVVYTTWNYPLMWDYIQGEPTQCLPGSGPESMRSTCP